MGDWSPLGGTEWLRNPDWVLDQELPEHPVKVPDGNGRPEPVPYHYHGTNFADPPFLAAVLTPIPRKTPRKPGPPPIDPGGVGILSAPPEWVREDHLETLWEAGL